MDGGGTVRPHWQSLVNGLSAMAPDVRARRWDVARRLIRENGITYNIYGDPQGLRRPWDLDFMPLVLSSSEWADIEAGLKQRVRLLNAVARDIYADQHLLKEGVLPASLMLGNPNFLRPLKGVPVPNNTFVHFYAADLARGPDGRWWVLSDRTQAPSGAGYAVENRTIMRRALPDLFETAHVQRLATFFSRWRDHLLSLVPRDTTRAVLLTPGPYNETYFEHVYLARYLGLTLAEGADLTVRDDTLYLKTLEGLKRVDLVLRRVDSEFCDPLELRTESQLGVPGLVRAVRAGNVVIANALGTGVLETQALHAFLPALAQHFGAGDLLLPDIATWWCGDPVARDHVISNLDQMAINRTAGEARVMAPAAQGTAGSDLGEAAREQLLRAMQLRGADFVAQELVTLSSAPVLQNGQLSARPMSLRCYVAAVGDDYMVMPGGMARFSADTEPRALSMQSGDGSKDVWVLGDNPPDTFSMFTGRSKVAAGRNATGDLPSRAADNLFWLGRYVERADASLRLVRACILRLAEPEAYPGGGAALSRLALLLRERADNGEPVDDTSGPVAVLLDRLNTLLTDPTHWNSIPSAIDNVQRTAYLVRDRLSLDLFRNITEFSTARAPLSGASSFETSPALAMVQENLTLTAALSGLQAENTTRGPGWMFTDMGKRIERARTLIAMLRALVIDGDPETNGSLALILELADSFMTYRTRHLASPALLPVLDLVLMDETNPRSIAFQIQALSQSVSGIPRMGRSADLSEDEHLVASLVTDLRMVDLDDLCPAPGEDPAQTRRGTLDAMLSSLDQRLADLSDVISRTYFAHAASQRISFAPRH